MLPPLIFQYFVILKYLDFNLFLLKDQQKDLSAIYHGRKKWTDSTDLTSCEDVLNMNKVHALNANTRLWLLY